MKHLITLLIITISTISFGQETTQDNCFKEIKIEPAFIAFSTSKESDLGKWYQNIFDLKIVKEFSFPDGSINGVLMRKGEFVVEFFYRDDILKGKDYVTDSKQEQWLGFMKFGMYTNANLKKLRDCLKKKGVKATRIFKDKNLGIDLLQIIDPEGNMLEIISRK